MTHREGVREGYPVIEDAAQPLWDAQQAGWPDHTVHEAWAEVLRSTPARFASSRNHPAFDAGYIVNDQATRPDDAPAEAAVAADKARR